MQLQPIGSYETKTHLAELLRRVQGGQGFTITQRGEPVADLLPAGSSQRRAGLAAAARMQAFMLTTPPLKRNAKLDIKALIETGRD
jgi:prevent-host-death family protein